MDCQFTNHQLPPDIYSHILTLTDPTDVIPMCSVNKELYEIGSNGNFKKTIDNITSPSRLYIRIEELVNRVGYGETRKINVRCGESTYIILHIDIKSNFTSKATEKTPFIVEYRGCANDESHNQTQYFPPSSKEFTNKNIKFLLFYNREINFDKIQNILDNRVKKIEEDNLYSNIKIISTIAPTILALGMIFIL